MSIDLYSTSTLITLRKNKNRKRESVWRFYNPVLIKLFLQFLI